MKHNTWSICLFLIMLAAGGCSSVSMAAEGPNLLIMGEDFDKDTVPRDSRIFRRVLNSVSNQLGDDGYVVYDETAITLRDFKQGRKRRPDAELIDIAKSITQPPIDILVLYTIYASAEDVEYKTRIFTRIEGRLLDVRSGRRLGNFEVDSPDSWSTTSPCTRECILEAVGDASKTLSNDLGTVLSMKLAAVLEGGSDSDSQLVVGGGNAPVDIDYTLIFDEFSRDEMLEVEEYLILFSEYRTHRPTYEGVTRSEIWYRSGLEERVMSRDLHSMLEALGMQAIVQYADGIFKVQRITLRNSKRKNPEENDW